MSTEEQYIRPLIGIPIRVIDEMMMPEGVKFMLVPQFDLEIRNDRVVLMTSYDAEQLGRMSAVALREALRTQGPDWRAVRERDRALTFYWAWRRKRLLRKR